MDPGSYLLFTPILRKYIFWRESGSGLDYNMKSMVLVAGVVLTRRTNILNIIYTQVLSSGVHNSISLIKERRKILTFERRKKNHVSRVCPKKTKNVIYMVRDSI